MRLLFLACGILFCSLAQGQFRNYNNYEIMLGYKPLRVAQGDVRFEYATTDSVMQNLVRGRFKAGPVTPPLLLQGGASFYVQNNFLVVAHAWTMMDTFSNRHAWGVGIGAGYRYRVNYMIDIQPELKLFYGATRNTINEVSYTGSMLTFEDLQFFEGAPVTGKYLNRQIALEPEIKFIADLTKRLELRASFAVQMTLLNREMLMISADLAPGQSEAKRIPFKEPSMQVLLNELPAEEPLLRLSGGAIRIGFGYKFMW